MNDRKVKFLDWGLIDYKEAWDAQQLLHDELKALKKMPDAPDFPGYFILCEHPAVYTLGKSGKMSHLLLAEDELEEASLQFYKINRGGDITHHGPGQIVGYLILDLEQWTRDVHLFVRKIEALVIQTLNTFNISTDRITDFTGVWTDKDLNDRRKICAIGVHLSRWVSMHGFALNVNNDLSLFQHIVPCGIQEEGKSVTSIEKELGGAVDMNLVKMRLLQQFENIFESTIEI